MALGLHQRQPERPSAARYLRYLRFVFDDTHPYPDSPTTTDTPYRRVHHIPRDPPTSAADMARRWAVLGIDDYSIALSIDHPNGMGGGDYDGVYSFEVRDGQIRDCAVTDRGANAELAEQVCETATSPVAFLFFWVDRLGTEHMSVRYDSKTHLPVTIQYDDPDSIDEEYEIRLVGFESLEARPRAPGIRGRPSVPKENLAHWG